VEHKKFVKVQCIFSKKSELMRINFESFMASEIITISFPCQST
jgi:hypothetical protein